MTGPIVKMPGGKTRLLPELLARLPPITGRYFEPFVGGAALFFALAPPRAVIADANLDLIETYRAVAGDVEAVIYELEQHQRRHGAKHFAEVKLAWNAREYWSAASFAGAFLYLNRTCFNGLWRVNRAGKFNVAFGSYADPFGDIADRMRAAAPVLVRAEIRGGSYVETLTDAGAGDVVYVDSPYDGDWCGYTAAGFTAADQVQLAGVVRGMAARGCRVLVSNSDTPRVRELYAGLQIESVQCMRSINCNAKGRGSVGEVIVTV
jgi:DNA adenine methylase